MRKELNLKTLEEGGEIADAVREILISSSLEEIMIINDEWVLIPDWADLFYNDSQGIEGVLMRVCRRKGRIMLVEVKDSTGARKVKKKVPQAVRTVCFLLISDYLRRVG